jgi:hypothetical protein
MVSTGKFCTGAGTSAGMPGASNTSTRGIPVRQFPSEETKADHGCKRELGHREQDTQQLLQALEYRLRAQRYLDSACGHCLLCVSHDPRGILSVCTFIYMCLFGRDVSR